MEDPGFLASIIRTPALVLVLLALTILMTLYLARKPFHRCMLAIGRMIYNTLRLAAASVKSLEKEVCDRNRQVLMTDGLVFAERRGEQEFDRIGIAVQRYLENFPEVQRKISEDLLKLEEDYRHCNEIPQSLPDWVKVIDAVANIKPGGDRMVVSMLEQIQQTLQQQHNDAVAEHRRDVAERHTLLSRMLPVWRAIHKTLDTTNRSIGNLSRHAKKIDGYMEDYEKVRLQTDMAARNLLASSLTRFLISALALAVGFMGAVVNFNLIALPMSEMVGGTSFIVGFKTSDVAGVFMVCLEIIIGIFLLDALQVTRLFAAIGNLDAGKRKILFWVLLVVLTSLATVEASLVFVRDRIIADMEALRQSLAGVEPAASATSAIPTIGHMVMGFVLPFVLIFAAIPFEAFIASTRTLLGLLSVLILRTLAFVLRLVGNLGFYLARLIVNIYDLIISPCIWLEGVFVKRFEQQPRAEKQKTTNDI